MTDPRLDPPPGAWVRLLARIARALLPLPSAPPGLEEIRSVLVVRTDDRVGNALLTIPLVRALQSALPRAQVDLLLAARKAQVAEGLPGLSVVRFDRRTPWRLPRRASYEVVVDAAHWHAFSLTSALLSRWAASRWVVGPERGPSFIYSRAAPLPAEGTPEVRAKLDLGRALGLELRDFPMETALGRGPTPVPGGRFVALDPGARKHDHRLPPERFAALARSLPLRSVVFWGPGEEEVARAVVDASAGSAELAPPTDLDQMAAAFRAAALVVTNDSGPMHLAVACGAPVLAFFNDSAGLRFAHPGPRFAAVAGAADASAAARRLLDSAPAPAEPARAPEERA